MVKKIILPLKQGQIKELRAGGDVLLSGIIYTARDQAHRRLSEAIKNKKALPINLKGALIYYCGPTPARQGEVIGSCGPTTSSRMDNFTPLLLKAGLRGMIGKGRRSEEVREAIERHKAVYFLAYSGCGALLSTFVKKAEVVAYPDLGAEAIYKLAIRDFPVVVGIDAYGNDIYSVRDNC